MTYGVGMDTHTSRIEIQADEHGEQRWLLNEAGTLRTANLGWWSNGWGWTPAPTAPDTEVEFDDYAAWAASSDVLASTLTAA